MGFLAGGPSKNVTRLTVEGAAITGQTIIPIPGGCTPGTTDVYIGGAILSQGDYDDSSGSQIVLTKQMAAGTQFRVVAYNATLNVSSLAIPASVLVTPALGATGIPISYTPGFVWLYRNGAKLPPSDFTAIDGANIMFVGFTGDGVTQYEVATWSSVTPANCLPANNPILTGPITFPDGSQLASSPIGRKNWLQNGAFSIWQRGTSFTNPSSTSTMYTADRWCAYRGSWAAGITVTKGTSGVANSHSCIMVARNSGDTSIMPLYLSTSFETADVLQMQGKQMTLSYDVFGSGNFVGLNFGMSVAWGTGTDGNIPIGFASQATLATKNTTLINGWQRASLTFTIPANATQLGIAGAVVPAGTAGASDWYVFTAAQLELGPVATPFELTNYADYLQRCQRFYSTFRMGVDIPSFAATSALGAMSNYPVTMRIAPTLSIISTVESVNFGSGVFDMTTNASTRYRGAAPAVGNCYTTIDVAAAAEL